MLANPQRCRAAAVELTATFLPVQPESGQSERGAYLKGIEGLCEAMLFAEL